MCSLCMPWEISDFQTLILFFGVLLLQMNHNFREFFVIWCRKLLPKENHIIYSAGCSQAPEHLLKSSYRIVALNHKAPSKDRCCSPGRSIYRWKQAFKHISPCWIYKPVCKERICISVLIQVPQILMDAPPPGTIHYH